MSLNFWCWSKLKIVFLEFRFLNLLAAVVIRKYSVSNNKHSKVWNFYESANISNKNKQANSFHKIIIIIIINAAILIDRENAFATMFCLTGLAWQTHTHILMYTTTTTDYLIMWLFHYWKKDDEKNMYNKKKTLNWQKMFFFFSNSKYLLFCLPFSTVKEKNGSERKKN